MPSVYKWQAPLVVKFSDVWNNTMEVHGRQETTNGMQQESDTNQGVPFSYPTGYY